VAEYNKSLDGAEKEFSTDSVGNSLRKCKQKIYLIMVADRPVQNTGGLFYHYSLEYWVSNVDVTLKENWDRPDFEEAHEGSAQLEAVELLREGGWSAYLYNEERWTAAGAGTAVIPIKVPRGWSEESVGISVIHYSSSSTNVLALYKGNQEDVKAKWDRAISLAKVYPYAEQNGFNGNFRNWPSSIYLIGNNVNNSNTFVRYLVKGMGLEMTEMTGSHPGRNSPSPVTDVYSTPWKSDQKAPARPALPSHKK
jgi:hypothetical protein